MKYPRWIAWKAISMLSRRYLKGKDLWKWHHKKMKNHPPYARILVQGVVQALWQKKLRKAMQILLITAAHEARYLKHGTDPTETD